MFVRAVRAAATTPSQTRALAAAPTLAAFAAALADELAAVQSALIGVQEDFAALVRQGGNSGADVGLIALEAAVQACPCLESQLYQFPCWNPSTKGSYLWIQEYLPSRTSLLGAITVYKAIIHAMSTTSTDFKGTSWSSRPWR